MFFSIYNLSTGNVIGAKRESLLRKWHHSYNCMLYECQHAVAHNCLGKTKKSRQNKENKFVSGLSAVVICIWNGASCNSNTLLARKTAIFFELTMFCSACVSVVDEDANFCKSCGRGTFLNLKCSYLHFF